MERAAAIGDSRSLFRLIKSICRRRPTVSELIKEVDGSLIYSKRRRLERWAEHFKGQFSWPKARSTLQNITGHSMLDVDTSPPTEQEVIRELSILKRYKAAGPDGISPSLLKDGGPALVLALQNLLCSIGSTNKSQKIGVNQSSYPYSKKVTDPPVKATEG